MPDTSSSNIFADLPKRMPDEVFSTLLTSENVRIERIVSHGHSSPEGFWYDQDQHEWVMVLKGQAKLRLGDELIEMKAGDYVNIPAHMRHRVEWTSPDEPTVWLAVHSGPGTQLPPATISSPQLSSADQRSESHRGR